MNYGANNNNGTSRRFLCCLATSNDENVIAAAKFDKCHYFDHISSDGPELYFDLYVILLFIEVFLFGTKTLCMIHLFRAI